MTYPKVDSQPNFPALENETLEFWATDGTFQASIDQRDAGTNGANEYVFYDGPPFANGLPHYGHLLTGFVKDAVPLDCELYHTSVWAFKALAVSATVVRP